RREPGNSRGRWCRCGRRAGAGANRERRTSEATWPIFGDPPRPVVIGERGSVDKHAFFVGRWATLSFAAPLIAALALLGADRAASPAYLPRYVAAGGYGGLGVFAPSVKIGWELALIEQSTELV